MASPMLREVGIVSRSSCVRFELTVVVVTSMTGLWPLTVIVSWTADSFSTASTRASNPALSTMPSRTIRWKPGSSNLTAYVPIGRLRS